MKSEVVVTKVGLDEDCVTITCKLYFDFDSSEKALAFYDGIQFKEMDIVDISINGVEAD